MKFVPSAFKREYFFYFNERGQLFHIFDLDAFLGRSKGTSSSSSGKDHHHTAATPRQFPSGPIYLRDTKFLNFFWRNLKVTPPSSSDGSSNEVLLPLAESTKQAFPGIDLAFDGRPLEELFPFVSTCAGEGNYLAIQDAPVVFHELDVGPGDGSGGDDDDVMRFAGDLREPFRAEKLRVGNDGRLYHPITALPQLSSSFSRLSALGVKKRRRRRRMLTEENGEMLLGLVGSNVGIKLGLEYFCEETDANGNYSIEWRGQKHVVPLLPPDDDTSL